MTKKEKVCAQIADKISAHRAVHGLNSIARIYMSKPLYEFLAGKKQNPRCARLFTYEIEVYDSDKMEYSFTANVFEVGEVK